MRVALTILFCLLVGTMCFAADQNDGETLSNQHVIDLLKAGLAKELVVQKIQTSDNTFDMSTKAMIHLKEEGVPDDVIALMLTEQKKQKHAKRSKIQLDVQHLASDRPEVREAAFLRLKQYGPAALSELRKTLGHIRPEMRLAAVQALGRLGDKQSADVIRNMLVDKDATIRLAAAEALGRLRDEDSRDLARKAVVGGLDPLDGYIRLLGYFKDVQSNGFIKIRLHEDSNAATRAQAAWALGEIGVDSSREALEHHLAKGNESAPEVRAAAAIALGKLADPASAEKIMRACTVDPLIRRETMLAMGSFPPATVVPFLINTLKRRLTGPETEAVLASLRKLTHQDFGGDYDRWRNWLQKNRASLEGAVSAAETDEGKEPLTFEESTFREESNPVADDTPRRDQETYRIVPRHAADEAKEGAEPPAAPEDDDDLPGVDFNDQGAVPLESGADDMTAFDSVPVAPEPEREGYDVRSLIPPTPYEHAVVEVQEPDDTSAMAAAEMPESSRVVQSALETADTLASRGEDDSYILEAVPGVVTIDHADEQAVDAESDYVGEPRVARRSENAPEALRVVVSAGKSDEPDERPAPATDDRDVSAPLAAVHDDDFSDDPVSEPELAAAVPPVPGDGPEMNADPAGDESVYLAEAPVEIPDVLPDSVPGVPEAIEDHADQDLPEPVMDETPVLTASAPPVADSGGMDELATEISVADAREHLPTGRESLDDSVPEVRVEIEETPAVTGAPVVAESPAVDVSTPAVEAVESPDVAAETLSGADKDLALADPGTASDEPAQPEVMPTPGSSPPVAVLRPAGEAGEMKEPPVAAPDVRPGVEEVAAVADPVEDAASDVSVEVAAFDADLTTPLAASAAAEDAASDMKVAMADLHADDEPVVQDSAPVDNAAGGMEVAVQEMRTDAEPAVEASAAVNEAASDLELALADLQPEVDPVMTAGDPVGDAAANTEVFVARAEPEMTAELETDTSAENAAGDVEVAVAELQPDVEAVVESNEPARDDAPLIEVAVADMPVPDNALRDAPDMEAKEASAPEVSSVSESSALVDTTAEALADSSDSALMQLRSSAEEVAEATEPDTPEISPSSAMLQFVASDAADRTVESQAVVAVVKTEPARGNLHADEAARFAEQDKRPRQDMIEPGTDHELSALAVVDNARIASESADLAAGDIPATPVPETEMAQAGPAVDSEVPEPDFTAPGYAPSELKRIAAVHIEQETVRKVLDEQMAAAEEAVDEWVDKVPAEEELSEPTGDRAADKGLAFRLFGPVQTSVPPRAKRFTTDNYYID